MACVIVDLLRRRFMRLGPDEEVYVLTTLHWHRAYGVATNAEGDVGYSAWCGKRFGNPRVIEGRVPDPKTEGPVCKACLQFFAFGKVGNGCYPKKMKYLADPSADSWGLKPSAAEVGISAVTFAKWERLGRITRIPHRTGAWYRPDDVRKLARAHAARNLVDFDE